MKTRMKKTSTVYSVLAVCLSAAPTVMGQTPQKDTLARSISANPAPYTPEHLAASVQQAAINHAAAVSLHAGRYAEAEAEARRSLSLDSDGMADEVLAVALDTQGKEQEALQAYHVIVVEQKAMYPRVLLPYSLLLLKSGQWEQALAVYNQALPLLGHEALEQESSHFSPDAPSPTALAVAIHLERGQLYNAAPDWAGEAQNTEAMAEYQKALQLAPDSALTNFYYGQGWQKLSPAEQAKFGTAQQTRAALQKAVKIGKGNVKKAAQKALMVAMKPH